MAYDLQPQTELIVYPVADRDDQRENREDSSDLRKGKSNTHVGSFDACDVFGAEEHEIYVGRDPCLGLAGVFSSEDVPLTVFVEFRVYFEAVGVNNVIPVNS